jgi:hypothetical protein
MLVRLGLDPDVKMAVNDLLFFHPWRWYDPCPPEALLTHPEMANDLMVR